MPHQVVKATVRGSKGDLAHITQAIRDYTGPGGEKVNIRYLAASESSPVGGIELGVITMILDPDEGAVGQGVLDAIRNAPLDNGRHVEHVDTYPNVHITLLDSPGSLNDALAPLTAANLNIISALSMGGGSGVADVGLGFATQADADAATTALGTANVIIHPPD
jgi:hypothetical protein